MEWSRRRRRRNRAIGGLSEEKGPLSVYQFFKATARQIKTDGSIDMTTP